MLLTASIRYHVSPVVNKAATDVTANTQILCPVPLICWIFMPYIDVAVLRGTYMKASIVTRTQR